MTAPDELAELRAQMRQVLDRQQIIDCLHRYTRGLDRHDPEILASVYHPDGVDRHGGFEGTPDVFVPWAHALLGGEWDIHDHFLDVNYVEIDGDTAHTETYVFHTQRRRDGAGVDIGAGRYIDRLERRDGDWRVVVRETVIDWQGRCEITWFGGGGEFPHGTWDKRDRSYERPLTLPPLVDGEVSGDP